MGLKQYKNANSWQIH
ncbi:hypothetical protein ACN38_g7608, partial [Penicillium nordicum]